VIVIIGEVTRLAHSMSWFDSRPLFGTTILVTRSEQQSDELARPLQELGAEVLSQPAIAITPLHSFADLDQQIDSIAKYDYLVFSSRNGVCHFMQRFLDIVGDVRRLSSVQLAVVGTRTAEMLASYHLKADVQAPGMTAQSLGETLLPAAPGNRFLLIRASRGPDTLAEQLAQAGGEVQSVVAYRHDDVAMADDSIIRRLAAGEIQWVTVTSDAIARSLVRLFGDHLHQTKLVSLSTGITATLRSLGLEPAAQAKQPTMQSLIEAISSPSETGE